MKSQNYNTKYKVSASAKWVLDSVVISTYQRQNVLKITDCTEQVHNNLNTEQTKKSEIITPENIFLKLKPHTEN